jgi:hypothetical protein
MKTLLALTIALALTTVADAQVLPQKPKIGDIYTIRVPVCRIDVAWNRKESLNFNYGAPAGWHVLDYKIAYFKKRQRARYTFQLVPANYSMLSEEIVSSKFKELLNVVAEGGKGEKYNGMIDQMRSDYERAFAKTFVSHSSLLVRGSVRGNNEFLSRKPGRLYLDLTIRVVYLPSSDEEFKRAIEVMRTLIKEDATPAEDDEP